MIKAVIFDFGGVIIANIHSYRTGISSVYGIKPEEVAEYMSPLMEDFRKGKISENTFWEKLSASLKKPVPENKEELWRKCYEENFSLNQEIIEFIKELKDRGLKIAILSNTIVPHVEIIRKHHDLKDFDATVFSCEVGLSKPDSNIYLLAAEKLGVKPEECIFTDDLEKNLIPAKELGMKTVLAKSPDQIIKDISSLL